MHNHSVMGMDELRGDLKTILPAATTAGGIGTFVVVTDETGTFVSHRRATELRIPMSIDRLQALEDGGFVTLTEGWRGDRRDGHAFPSGWLMPSVVDGQVTDAGLAEAMRADVEVTPATAELRTTTFEPDVDTTGRGAASGHSDSSIIGAEPFDWDGLLSPGTPASAQALARREISIRELRRIADSLVNEIPAGASILERRWIEKAVIEGIDVAIDALNHIERPEERGLALARREEARRYLMLADRVVSRVADWGTVAFMINQAMNALG